MNKKVSIITPCLNGERCIDQYMKSVLSQSYYPLELIFVNDGSTDRTEELVKSYEKELKENGVELIYIYQENTGIAGAVNRGLEILTGEYFIFPDVDDILEKDSIHERVEFLNKNPDYGMVSSRGSVALEECLFERKRFKQVEKSDYQNLFMNLLSGKICPTPISYMIRSSAFFDVFPSRQIFNSRANQDIHMILPMAYHYKCGFIDKDLFVYVIRKDSHSNSFSSYPEKMQLWNIYESLFIHCLEHMDLLQEERLRYLQIVHKRIKEIVINFNMLYLWEKYITYPQYFSRKEYVIFGAGENGQEIFHLLQRKNINVKYFVDNDPKKQSALLEGLAVKPTSVLLTLEKGVGIIVGSCVYRQEIETELIRMGFKENTDFCYYKKFLYKCVSFYLNDFSENIV